MHCVFEFVIASIWLIDNIARIFLSISAAQFKIIVMGLFYRVLQLISVSAKVGGGFFTILRRFGRKFDHLFPACTLFYFIIIVILFLFFWSGD